MSRNTIEIKYYLGKHWSHGDWLSIMLKIASDGSVFLYSIKGKKVQCISYLHHVFVHTFQFSTWLLKFAMYNWWIHQRCCQSKEIWHNFWWQHQHKVQDSTITYVFFIEMYVIKESSSMHFMLSYLQMRKYK